MTGIKLGLVTIAIGALGLPTVDSVSSFAEYGLGGLAIAALIYVYRDMKKSEAEKIKIMADNAATLKSLMDEHNKVLSDMSTAQAKAISVSTEVARANTGVLVEIKDAWNANNSLIATCHEITMAKVRGQ